MYITYVYANSVVHKTTGDKKARPATQGAQRALGIRRPGRMGSGAAHNTRRCAGPYSGASTPIGPGLCGLCEVCGLGACGFVGSYKLDVCGLGFLGYSALTLDLGGRQWRFSRLCAADRGVLIEDCGCAPPQLAVFGLDVFGRVMRAHALTPYPYVQNAHNKTLHSSRIRAARACVRAYRVCANGR